MMSFRKESPSRGNGGVRREMPAGRVASQARSAAEAVVSVLSSCLGGRRAADRCLHEYCSRNHQLGSRDRRLISETLFSVLRWWGWLRKLAPVSFRQALEQGAAEPPVHPDQWNGVLAAAWVLENRFDFPPCVCNWLRDARLYPELFQGLSPETPVAERRRNLRPFFQEHPMPALALEELLPEWTAQELSPLPEGASFKTLVEWMQKRPPVWLRAQGLPPRELSRQLLQETQGAARPAPHALMHDALFLKNTAPALQNTAVFRNGGFEIQDLASQAVGLVCDPRAGQQWWDACAGGGGKTLHLAQLMKNRGILEATDLREAALEEIRLRARRGHFGNIRMKTWQGNGTPQNFRDRFDGVLVDTPCSCSGTWRRNPGRRWNTTRDSLEEFARLQAQILRAAAPAVKPGGTLVYSTCSMIARENQKVVEDFLDENPQFILTPHTDPVTGKTSGGMTQHWPWDGDCDAMFTAKLTRRRV